MRNVLPAGREVAKRSERIVLSQADFEARAGASGEAAETHCGPDRGCENVAQKRSFRTCRDETNRRTNAVKNGLSSDLADREFDAWCRCLKIKSHAYGAEGGARRCPCAANFNTRPFLSLLPRADS